MSASRGHGERVLVADDSEANRELLIELLTADGYHVVPAANGSGALEQIRSGSIDLALLDVVMPRPTGFEICQWMKSSEETRLIPVAALAAVCHAFSTTFLIPSTDCSMGRERIQFAGKLVLQKTHRNTKGPNLNNWAFW